MKTVEFVKTHNFGGHIFYKGDKLECSEKSAKDLAAAGVIKKGKKDA